MKRFYGFTLACLVLTSSGCTTVQLRPDESTYSGEAAAAVTKQVTSATNYVRGLFSKPLPTWQPAAEKSSAPTQAAAVTPAPIEKRDPADTVKTFPINMDGR